MMIWQKLLMGEDGGPGLIVVAAHGENGSGGNLTGVTINGNGMTAVVNAIEGGRIAVGLYSYRIAAGTTADIVVSFSATMNRAVIGVWRLQGLLSDTAYDTAGINGSGSVSLDGLAGGVGIAAITDNDDERRTCTGPTLPKSSATSTFGGMLVCCPSVKRRKLRRFLSAIPPTARPLRRVGAKPGQTAGRTPAVSGQPIFPPLP